MAQTARKIADTGDGALVMAELVKESDVNIAWDKSGDIWLLNLDLSMGRKISESRPCR